MVLLTMLVFISPWFHFVVWIFAATRVANLSNDIFYDRIRSPKNEEEIEDIITKEDEDDEYQSPEAPESTEA